MSEQLPRLPSNPRLERNIRSLLALLEPGTLSVENTDEAVNDFDDRLKAARGKVKIIEKMVGEDGERTETNDLKPDGGSEAAETAKAPSHQQSVGGPDW